MGTESNIPGNCIADDELQGALALPADSGVNWPQWVSLCEPVDTLLTALFWTPSMPEGWLWKRAQQRASEAIVIALCQKPKAYASFLGQKMFQQTEEIKKSYSFINYLKDPNLF